MAKKPVSRIYWWLKNQYHGYIGFRKTGVTDILVAEKWCQTDTGSGELAFYKTKTGEFNNSNHSSDFIWRKIENNENCIRLAYKYMAPDGQLAESVTD
ncbi:MAG: hypothetical protein K5989_12575 [Lachnospiraceae bacterium]|nr:hypothetical protein [Lachnospiraceae bacterium]